MPLRMLLTKKNVVMLKKKKGSTFTFGSMRYDRIYNSTNGGVGTFDQMCGNICKYVRYKKTKGSL